MEEQESIKNKTLHHLNPKLTKVQASTLNLPKLLSQFHKEFIQGNDFRESSLFLCELANVYLKQFKYLRVDIENLKNSLFLKEIEDEKIKKKTKEKVKDEKKQKSNNDSEFNIEQNTFTFKDQPRNLVSAEKIQLQNQQRTSVDVEKMLKRGNAEQLDSQYKIELVVKDLSQIQKQSLGEVLNKTIQRKRELTIPKTFTNFQIEQEQPSTEENFEEEEEQHMFFEENENLQQQEIKLKSQKIYPEMPFQQQQENKKTKPQKQRNRVKKIGFIDSRIQEETDFEYKRNIQSFLKISQKVDDLQLKMELLKLEPEFWAKDDALFGLINQISISDPQQILFLNSTDLQNALTSPIRNEKKDFHYNQCMDEQESCINEFSYWNVTQPKMRQSQKDMSYYTQLIQNMQKKLQNQCIIQDEEYFRTCANFEQNKAKQFYDLLIMSRIGMVQLQQLKKNDNYSEISFTIK